MAIYYGTQKIKPSGIKNVYVGNSKVYESTPIIEPDYLYFKATENSVNIKFSVKHTLSVRPILQYRINYGSWNVYTYGSNITLNNNDKCYWKGDGASLGSPNGWLNFSSTGYIEAHGNIMSLVDETCESLTIPYDYCFIYLFDDCKKLLTAPSFPATTLKTACYEVMFRSCESLTIPPELPSLVVPNKAYYAMFDGCYSLIQTPQLPATTIGWLGYCSMFSGCRSLVKVSKLPNRSFLNDGTIEGDHRNDYSQMFQGCSSLYASETQTAEAPYAWRIPTSGTINGEMRTYNLFYGCLGTRSVEDPIVISQGSYKTYYTQNPPL